MSTISGSTAAAGAGAGAGFCFAGVCFLLRLDCAEFCLAALAFGFAV